ncbi:hypothetical protein HMPREF9022_04760 [Erysipelotrichaceae bacterium 2_2_44A]|nr:hypothetical protein HMPREF9022_04760 [Erysipelotrichaceae bacterium 2_2_44A]
MNAVVAVENKKGERLELTKDPDYIIGQIDGLGPPTAQINTSKMVGYDGETFISSTAGSKPLDIYIYFQGDVEDSRIRLYKYIHSKEYLKVYYQNSHRDVYIEGYVQDIKIDHFADMQMAQVSLLCPDPYFKNIVEQIDGGSQIIDEFTFEFTCDEGESFEFGTMMEITEIVALNRGEITNGITFRMRMNGIVTDPKIFNRATGESFGISYTFQAGDVVTISTRVGNKSVKLMRDAQEINIFNSIMPGSKWLQLDIGDNVFIFEAAAGQSFIELFIIHRDEYEGV